MKKIFTEFMKNLALTGLSICLTACFGLEKAEQYGQAEPAKSKIAAEQTQQLTLKPVLFSMLPGWDDDHHATAFPALQASCRSILAGKKSTVLESTMIKVNIQDWKNACKAALKLQNPSNSQARHFLQTWFQPYAVYADNNNPIGLFTGYYLPSFNATSKKTSHFSVPLYAKPEDLIVADLSIFNPKWAGITLAGRVVNDQLVPYQMPRKAIDAGALNGKAKIIAWMDPIDRFFLQVQGSGFLTVDGKRKIFVGYNGHNGSAYTSIGKVLVERGELDKTTISMYTIREWLSTHPQQAQEVMEQDNSFVFFKILPHQQALGTANLPLTAGRSLAIDRQFIPLNLPLWVDTTIPDIHQPQQSIPLQRLFIAQDTGGAIKGPVRADLYWGSGSYAEFLAGQMHQPGRYWLLLPRHAQQPTH